MKVMKVIGAALLWTILGFALYQITVSFIKKVDSNYHGYQSYILLMIYYLTEGIIIYKKGKKYQIWFYGLILSAVLVLIIWPLLAHSFDNSNFFTP